MSGADEVALKPCPFCGAAAALKRKAHGWVVHCTDRFEDCPVNGRTRYCGSADMAAKLWNTRAKEERHG